MTKKTETKTKAEDVVITEEARKVSAKVAESAREMVRRSAATAKERSDDVFEGTEKFNSGLESTMNRMVGGYVTILGGIAKATHDNVNRALTTVEKLANARSMSEAVKIQADYIRENTNANIENLRTAANVTRETVAEGTATVRDAASKAWPYGKAA